jgi:5-methylcytosine-specific restriction endonuclease McrA
MTGAVRGGRQDLHGVGSNALRVLRKAAVDAHRVQHGDWCPGYSVQPHNSTDLTADHVVSVALGGDPAGPFAVLCRSCNARKGKAGHTLVTTPSVRTREWI